MTSSRLTREIAVAVLAAGTVDGSGAWIETGDPYCLPRRWRVVLELAAGRVESVLERARGAAA